MQEIGIEKDNIIVVVKEIEGWYLAGLSAKISRKLGIPHVKDTNDMTKEDFNRLMPKKIGSRIAFMEKILKVYDIEIAKRKNESLRCFLDKYGF